MKRFRLRVVRARKRGWLKSKNKKHHLIIKLRGWGHIFSPSKMRLPERHSETCLTPKEKKMELAIAQSGKFWYRRTYTIGKGGLCRKDAIKSKFLCARARNSNAVPRRKVPRIVKDVI